MDLWKRCSCNTPSPAMNCRSVFSRVYLSSRSDQLLESVVLAQLCVSESVWIVYLSVCFRYTVTVCIQFIACRPWNITLKQKRAVKRLLMKYSQVFSWQVHADKRTHRNTRSETDRRSQQTHPLCLPGWQLVPIATSGEGKMLRLSITKDKALVLGPLVKWIRMLCKRSTVYKSSRFFYWNHKKTCWNLSSEVLNILFPSCSLHSSSFDQCGSIFGELWSKWRSWIQCKWSPMHFSPWCAH